MYNYDKAEDRIPQLKNTELEHMLMVGLKEALKRYCDRPTSPEMSYEECMREMAYIGGLRDALNALEDAQMPSGY